MRLSRGRNLKTARDRMKNRTNGSGGDAGTATEALRASVALIEGMTGTLAGVLVELRAGQFARVGDLIGLQQGLEIALMRAIGLERIIHEWSIETDGRGGGDGDLDLDAARDAIGCRLDRLRACCHEE